MIRLKKTILFLFFIILTNIYIYPHEFKNISIKRIQEKEEFYKELFNTNKKIKKAAFTSIGAGIAILTSYQGFKLWENLNHISKKENITSIKTIITTNKQTSENKSLLGSTINLFTHGINKGIKKSGTMIVLLTISYIISDLLKPLKDKTMKFFKLNDQEHFDKIKKILIINLIQLREIFLLESPMCIIEEIADHYNFFLEIAENLLAFTSVIINKKNHSLTNYESIKNQQNIMYENIYNLSEKLNITLSNTKEKYLNQKLTSEILDDFRAMNNQTYRFINFLEAVLYEI